MDKPRVVLFDVDGTLMLNTGGRSFYDWDRVGEDTSNEAVVELAQNIIKAGDLEIVVMSGRDEVCSDATAASLAAQGVFFRELGLGAHRRQRVPVPLRRQLQELHVLTTPPQGPAPAPGPAVTRTCEVPTS